MINARSAAKTNHFKLGPGDLVLPCPFCGNETINADQYVEDGGLEMKNTYTASYWIACPCGVEVAGDSYQGCNERSHKAAAKSALEKWNTRVKP